MQRQESSEMSKRAIVLVSGGLDSCVLLNYVVQHVQADYVYGLSFYYGQRHGRELEMAEKQMEMLSVENEHVVEDISCYGKMLNGTSTLVADGDDVPQLEGIDEQDLDQPPTYVPNRNMVFLALAAGFAEARGAPVVYYGAHRQDEYSYWDCTDRFIERMNSVLELNRRTPIQVEAPFVNMSKADIVREGTRLNVDFTYTWSCYKGGKTPCGSCPTCQERKNAFVEAGVQDPLHVESEL